MTQPTPYARAYSFQNWQVSNPTRPLPADKLESELAAVAVTLSQTLANLAVIQKDDRTIANLSIGFDQLKPELLAGFPQPNAWVTAHAYAKNDMVFYGASLYRAVAARTSGAFATNLADGYWQYIMTVALPGGSTVSSFNGRVDTVVPLVGDYSAFYQPLNAALTSISGLTTSADNVLYFSGANTAALAAFTAYGRSLVATANAAAARAALGLVIGTNVQAWAAVFDAIAALGTTGIKVRTGANTVATVSLIAPAAGLTITNPDGIAGNPTFALANDIAALEALASTGIARRTGADAWSVGTLVAGSEIATNTVANSNLSNMAANSFKGNNTGSSAVALDLTVAQAKTLLAVSLTSDVSGVLQAAQEPAHTGDVTNTAGSLALTIAAGAVTLAKMTNLAANSIIGNNTGIGATPIALTAAQVKTLLAVSLTSDVTGVLQAAQEPAHTGDVTNTAGSLALTIAAGAVTLAKMANLAANSILGNNTGVGATPIALTAAQVKTLLAISTADVSGLAASATTDTTNAANISSGTLPAGRLPALTGDVTTTVGTVATTIAANAVTNAKAAQMAANTFKGNNTGSLANALDLTVAQAKTLLAITLSSDVVGTLQAAQFPALTGDVTTSVGALATTIATGAVTLAKMATLAASSFIGNNTGVGATPIALTVAQSKTLLAISLTSDVSGVLQAAQEPAHTGDVTNTAGSLALTIAAGAVTLAKMANLAANSIIGNNTGIGATPIALTAAQVKTLLAISLSTDVTGTLAVANGGTGITAFGTGVATALGASVTGSGGIALATSPALTTPAITGLATGSGIASAATASTLATRDANANISANSFLSNFATTVTAVGTTTLTVSSPPLQFFTGTTTQTVTLPVVSTLVLGQPYTIVNQSSGAITVNSSGGNLVQTVAAGNALVTYAILTTGTTAASWGSYYVSSGSGTGTVTSITAGAGLSGGTITTTGTIALSAPVSVANGGTGATTLTTGAVLTGTGASAVTASPVTLSAAGQINAIAGTTTDAPIKIASGTLNTTAAAGAVEYDGTAFYASQAASTRQVISTKQMMILSSAYTLVSQTAAQKLFNSSTNGQVTLPVGTYRFRCIYTMSSMAAGGAFGFALGGTAVKTEAWAANSSKPSTLSGGSASITQSFNTAANVAISAGSTNTFGVAQIEGSIRVTTAGTIIPQVSLGTAAAAIVGVNSFFEIEPVGSSTVTTVGNWS